MAPGRVRACLYLPRRTRRGQLPHVALILSALLCSHSARHVADHARATAHNQRERSLLRSTSQDNFHPITTLIEPATLQNVPSLLMLFMRQGAGRQPYSRSNPHGARNKP